MTQEIEFEREGEGAILKADNLGSLEALIGIFKDKVPIKKAEIGNVFRKDVIEAENVKDRLKRAIIAFNVDIDDVAAKEAKDKSITILQNKVIYQLVESYDKFIEGEKEKIRLEKLDTIIMPAKIRILPGHVFQRIQACRRWRRGSRRLDKERIQLKKNGVEVGEIKAIQSEGAAVEKAVAGDKVAVSIEGPTVGRQIDEGDELTTVINDDTIKVLKELGMKAELELAREIK